MLPEGARNHASVSGSYRDRLLLLLPDQMPLAGQSHAPTCPASAAAACHRVLAHLVTKAISGGAVIFAGHRAGRWPVPRVEACSPLASGHPAKYRRAAAGAAAYRLNTQFRSIILNAGVTGRLPTTCF